MTGTVVMVRTLNISLPVVCIAFDVLCVASVVMLLFEFCFFVRLVLAARGL